MKNRSTQLSHRKQTSLLMRLVITFTAKAKYLLLLQELVDSAYLLFSGILEFNQCNR